MNGRRWAVPAAAVVALGALVAGFLATTEQVEEEVLVGATGLARANPYLAAERVINKLGVPARSSFGGHELPPIDHAVVLVSTDPAPRAALTDDLANWVADGGHLLLAPADGVTDFESGDPLLSALGVNTATDEQPGPATGVQVAFGDGHVTALRSLAPLDNDHLGEDGHADLLWEVLLTHGAPPAGVLLMVESGQDSLAALLWRHAWPLLLAGAALGLAWAWRASGRLGPTLPAPERVRRNTLEHIEAAGRFHWQNGHQERLLASTRAAVLRQLSHRASVGSSMAGGERVHAVARATGLDEDLVREALHGGGAPVSPQRTHDRRNFTRAMQALTSLWSAR